MKLERNDRKLTAVDPREILIKYLRLVHSRTHLLFNCFWGGGVGIEAEATTGGRAW